METHEAPTVANADLWTRYFQDEWSFWLNPLGAGAGTPVAEGTAARVAGFLTLVAAGPIAWLYNSNAPKAMPAHSGVPSPIRTADEMESIEEIVAA